MSTHRKWKCSVNLPFTKSWNRLKHIWHHFPKVNIAANDVGKQFSFTIGFGNKMKLKSSCCHFFSFVFGVNMLLFTVSVFCIWVNYEKPWQILCLELCLMSTDWKWSPCQFGKIDICVISGQSDTDQLMILLPDTG